MFAYLETSIFLAMAKEAASFDELSNYSLVISDMVVAEVHNVDEPWREWVARFLKNREVMCLRVEKEDLEFARKYVYNKALSIEKYSLGVHYLLCCVKGIDRCYSCDPLLGQLKTQLDAINAHFKKPVVDVAVVPCEDYPRQELVRVRSMIGKLCQSQGEVRLLSAVKESVEFFCREKGLTLRRVSKL